MRKPNLRMPSIGRGRRTVGAAGALLAVAIALVVIIGAGSPDQSKGASPSKGVAGSTTVQYRNLVATDTESGTLSYANPQTVYNRLSGTITWLPAVGAVIKAGGTLFDVDNAPVLLFNGSTPAYRDLDSSDTAGPDILELNRDLKKMGFDSGNEITVDDEWQAGTTDAVERWQTSLGETETGTITLGQIVFLPGQQEIDTLDTTVGSTGGASGAGTGDASYVVGTAHAEFVDDTTTTSPTTGATGATGATGTAAASDAAASCNGLDVQAGDSTATNPKDAGSNATDPAALPNCNQKGPTGPVGVTGATGGRGPSQEAVLLALLKAETLELKKSLAAAGTGTGHGATSGSGNSGATTGGGSFTGGGGGGGGGGGASTGGAAATSGGSTGTGGAGSSSGATASAILQTSATNVIVSVELDATKQSEAKVGEHVSVEMPTGRVVEGKITVVSPIAQSSSADTGSGSSGSGGSGSGGSGSGGSAASATIPVTIALLAKHLPTTGLDQAAVSVNFQQQFEKHVLSVPVTALLATNGGGYAVQQAAAPHKLIPVTPGLFAAGDVQITGSGIYPGLQVTDSQG
jgi:hypothetical protein